MKKDAMTTSSSSSPRTAKPVRALRPPKRGDQGTAQAQPASTPATPAIEVVGPPRPHPLTNFKALIERLRREGAARAAAQPVDPYRREIRPGGIAVYGPDGRQVHWLSTAHLIRKP